MMDKTARIDAIVVIMNEAWDLPPDCNAGELVTHAEVLFDHIQAGDSREALYRHLADVQGNKLRLPESDASRDIVDRSIDLCRTAPAMG